MPRPASVAVDRAWSEIGRLRQRAEQLFTPTVANQAHAADIAYVERKAEGVLGFLAVLDGRWRAIRSRWQAYRLASYQPSLLDQAAELKQVDRLRAERQASRPPTRMRVPCSETSARRADRVGHARRVRPVGRRVPQLRDAARPRGRRDRDCRATAA
jgi:hypothetical protein